MPSIAERFRAATNALLGRVPDTRSPKAPLAGKPYSMGAGGGHWSVFGERRGSRTLRKFSEQNVWVRVAINRRKREIARANWSIMRIDDPKAVPDPKVVAIATDLFRFVNDMRVSLNWLLNMLVEDILVLDAGVLEIERKANGSIAALWPIPGEEIAPDPSWDGSDPRKARYLQIRDGIKIASYLNDELIYMMANPRTNSAVGLSPLEVLMATVEADLYGEKFEYNLMRETAPAGILYLGGGVPPDKVDGFREQWEQEIAGTRDVAIIGSGGFDPETGTMSAPPEFIPFTRSARDEQRREYMKWLATKVAAAFEMDLMAFNLSESIHRSVGANLQQKTDQGLLGLASVISEFITREIMWQIDPTHRHGFQFLDLTPADELQKWQVRRIAMSIGCTFPNELRGEDGDDPVPWGDIPWPTQVQAKASDPAEINPGIKPPDDEETEPENKPEPEDDEEDDA